MTTVTDGNGNTDWEEPHGITANVVNCAMSGLPDGYACIGGKVMNKKEFERFFYGF